MRRRSYGPWVAILASFALAACFATTNDPRSTVAIVGEQAGFHTQWISAGRFTLLTASRAGQPGQPLRVYIEGDGKAWINRITPSRDPTPDVPVAWLMARADTGASGGIAWIARPCQYTRGAGVTGGDCHQRYWTNARSAPEVVEAIGQAIDRLRALAGADSVDLVGFSGGAGIAALLAAGRADVRALITVAGNLDYARFSHHHGISPLSASVDPAGVRGQWARVPQVHFVGTEDEIAPPSLVRASVPNGARVIQVPGLGHEDANWAQVWPSLLTSHWPCSPM